MTRNEALAALGTFFSTHDPVAKRIHHTDRKMRFIVGFMSFGGRAYGTFIPAGHGASWVEAVEDAKARAERLKAAEAEPTPNELPAPDEPKAE